MEETRHLTWGGCHFGALAAAIEIVFCSQLIKDPADDEAKTEELMIGLGEAKTVPAGVI